jgi:hypothetical protein
VGLVLLNAFAIALVVLSASPLTIDGLAYDNGGSRRHGGSDMQQVDRPAARPEISRRTLRLTIRSSEKGLELVSVEHLPMITPPQPGDQPDASRHGGHWFELRDGEQRVLAHRVIDDSLLNSVDVHSPDGTIRRVFGEQRQTTFEVLLPDVDGGRFAVLVGDPIAPVTGQGKKADATPVRASDIVQFDLSQVRK